jgi:hypothetical protein
VDFLLLTASYQYFELILSQLSHAVKNDIAKDLIEIFKFLNGSYEFEF